MDLEVEEPSTWDKIVHTYNMKLQYFMDKTQPYIKERWAVSAILILAYLVSVFRSGGFEIITYTLGIYILNLLIQFVSPKFDPELDESNKNDIITTDDEFKPFVRYLPEQKFWFRLTKAVLIAFVGTFFPILSIPVFRPILVIYFIILVVITAKRQIEHMIKYNYVPWDFGKKHYGAASSTPSASTADSLLSNPTAKGASQ